MAIIYLHNTLGNKKEKFIPIKDGEVRMYNCGPTVYNYVHIGNLRSFLFADLLRRTFEYNNYQVTQVINITDIGHLRGDADDGEDKMTTALKREGLDLSLDSLRILANKYTSAFMSDLISLNIKAPSVMPRASEHIAEDINLLDKLERGEFIYKTSDGLYFDTSKDVDYGKLGGINKDAKEDEARITINIEKKNPHDFAVWKFNDELGWDTKWGKGFPGWHIECSAMAMKYLGETFDVHTGGIDHIPIHHNNEIAQSESATGKSFANYWLHNAFININNEKIAKSTGNDIYLSDIIAKGLSPLSYRYYLLGAHYSTPMNFNWEALQGAEAAVNRIVGVLAESNAVRVGEISAEYKEKFLFHINHDLDTPKALALIFDLIQNPDISLEDKKETILDFDNVLGLGLKGMLESQYFKIPEQVASLLKDREAARENKDWQESDEIRDEINKLGFDIKDTDGEQKISQIK